MSHEGFRWPSPRFARLGQLIGLNTDRTPIHMDAHQIIKLKTCETSKTSSTFFRVTIFRVFELTPWAFLRERVLCRWRVSAPEVSNKIRHLSPTSRLTFLHAILLTAGQLAQQCPAVFRMSDRGGAELALKGPPQRHPQQTLGHKD